MTNSLMTFVLSVFFLMSAMTSYGAIGISSTDASIKKEHQENKLSKKEMKVAKKEFKKSLKKEIKELRKEQDTDLILLVILGIFIPPLAMWLHEGDFTNRFWISLVLSLLFLVPGIIYTLIVILGEN